MVREAWLWVSDVPLDIEIENGLVIRDSGGLRACLESGERFYVNVIVLL